MMRELDEGLSEPLGGSEVRRAQRLDRGRWEVRAAQWQALELARATFGGAASARLSPYGSRGGFQGLVHLEVPFSDLHDHRCREARFLNLAARDSVVQQVSLIFVFDPMPRDSKHGVRS